MGRRGIQDNPGLVIPISYGSTEVIETGQYSYQKPQTVCLTAPCQEACPAGINVPQLIYLSQQGRYAEALANILRENPFPGVCGRVCYHPCENGCNRAHYDESVSIHIMERYVSDVAAKQLRNIQPLFTTNSGKIAVVGAGPAGLSCAYFLALLGHHPTIFEAKREPGGVMRWGIPDYRLPKAVLKKEIRRILSLPIDIRAGVRIGKEIPFAELEKFDAIFLSPGAAINAPLSIEGECFNKVWKGGEFLERINSKEKIDLGKETIVIGGGNTAMDVARSALRLGSQVIIAYRRSRNEMPAIPDEIAEAEEEGIQFRFLIQPVKIESTPNKRLAVTFQRMTLSAPDSSNRPKAIPLKDDFLTLETDSLISAVGELVDLSWIPQNLIKNDLIDAASAPKIFAGGDAVPQSRTIVTAIAAGKKAAISMDYFFRGEAYHEGLSRIRVGKRESISMEAYLQGRENGTWPKAREVVTYQQINPLYFEADKIVKMRKLSRGRRLSSFSEVNLGYDAKKALLAASRCYSCGMCNYCGNCSFFCPEAAISIDPAQGIRAVDYAHCKGCGTCVKACPKCAVEMKNLP